MKFLNNILSYLVFVFLIFITIQPGDLGAKNDSSVGQKLWNEAADRYRNGEFDRAAEIYEELALAEPLNIPVLKNLAICYARLDQYPHALLLLRQLRTYFAGGSEVAEDIALLRQKLSLDGPEPVAALEAVALRFGLNPYPWFGRAKNLPFYLSSFLLLGGFLSVAIARSKKNRVLHRIGFIIGLLGVLVAALIIIQAFTLNEESEATVLFNTQAWSGPDKNNFQPISGFDSGEIVTIISPRLEAGFARVELIGGKTGFIPVNSLGVHEIGFLEDKAPFSPIFIDEVKQGQPRSGDTETTEPKAASLED